ncbi:hypothetical protein Fcan01_20663 [Folsomia candida]|uniref:Uncharacterized protein n=1 Tax=Folsomia candida TaxID=158441 RepID=A0A226DHF0_FOLCA|nr:hypothetical protein Fcan01_20663 [Folsomia candida]
MSSFLPHKPHYDKIWEEFQNQAQILGETTILPGASDLQNDASWTLDQLSHTFSDVMKELRSVKLPHDSGVQLDQPFYTPYGKPSMTLDPDVGLAEAHQLVQEAWKRRHIFRSTRLESTLKSILRSYTVEKKRLGLVSEKSFQFTPFPAKLRKGSEAGDLVRNYKQMGVTDLLDIQARAARDYYTSIYLFLYLRGFSVKNLTVSASAMCLTTCIDYVGALDDPCMGGKEAYMTAMLDSLKVKGAKWASGVDEVITTCAFLSRKMELVDQYEKDPTLSISPSHPTPLEYMENRWWDGALPIYFKLPLLYQDDHGVPITDKYAPIGTSQCHEIKKAIETIIRYNELADVHNDIFAEEPFNEVHLAGRYGGLPAVIDYADVCASTVDEVAACNCGAGDASHDYGTDMAIGSVAWFSIVPHYRVVTHLAETHEMTDPFYAALTKKARHGAFITGKIADTGKQAALHHENWVPTHKMTSLSPYTSGECKHCAVIGDWVVNRCLYRDDRPSKSGRLRKFVTSEVHLQSSVVMEGFWGQVVTLIAGNEFPKEIVTRCRDVVDAVWETLRAAQGGASPDEMAKCVVNNHMAIDQTIIATHSVERGHVLRRAMVGALSTMVDRTDVAVYQRMMDSSFCLSGVEVNRVEE